MAESDDIRDEMTSGEAGGIGAPMAAWSLEVLEGWVGSDCRRRGLRKGAGWCC